MDNRWKETVQQYYLHKSLRYLNLYFFTFIFLNFHIKNMIS